MSKAYEKCLIEYLRERPNIIENALKEEGLYTVSTNICYAAILYELVLEKFTALGLVPKS